MKDRNKVYQRECFVFFTNWSNTINSLPEEYQLETYKAVISFMSSGIEPTGLSQISQAIITSFLPSIEKSIRMDKRLKGHKKGNPNFKKGERNPYYPSPDEKENDLLDHEEETTLATEEKAKTDNKKNKKIIEDKKEIFQDNCQIIGVNYPYNNKEIEKEEEKEINFCLSKNKINNLSPAPAPAHVHTHAHAHTHTSSLTHDAREMKDNLLKKTQQYYSYWGYDEKGKQYFSEVVKTIVKALSQAKQGDFKYRFTSYSEIELLEKFDYIEAQDLRDIVWQVMNNDEIKDLYIYILGALLNRAEENYAYINSKTAETSADNSHSDVENNLNLDKTNLDTASEETSNLEDNTNLTQEKSNFNEEKINFKEENLNFSEENQNSIEESTNLDDAKQSFYQCGEIIKEL